jgi:hypothetical protein
MGGSGRGGGGTSHSWYIAAFSKENVKLCNFCVGGLIMSGVLKKLFIFVGYILAVSRQLRPKSFSQFSILLLSQKWQG